MRLAVIASFAALAAAGRKNEPRPAGWHHDDLHVNERFDCYREGTCLKDMTSPCRIGYDNVGWDHEHCEKGEARPICCAKGYTESIPEGSKCQWQKCFDGAGKPGDVLMFRSGVGGEPSVDPNESGRCKLHSFQKHFTCPLPEFDCLTQHCHWGAINEECVNAQWKIANWQPDHGSSDVNNFCCPKDRYRVQPLSHCHWAGHGSCENSGCNPYEVVVRTEDRPEGGHCHENRKKSLCCLPRRSAIKG